MESAWTAKRKIPTLRASSGRTNPGAAPLMEMYKASHNSTFPIAGPRNTVEVWVMCNPETGAQLHKLERAGHETSCRMRPEGGVLRGHLEADAPAPRHVLRHHERDGRAVFEVGGHLLAGLRIGR